MEKVTLTHPALPDVTLSVVERGVKEYEQSGWRRADAEPTQELSAPLIEIPDVPAEEA